MAHFVFSNCQKSANKISLSSTVTNVKVDLNPIWQFLKSGPANYNVHNSIGRVFIVCTSCHSDLLSSADDADPASRYKSLRNRNDSFLQVLLN
jgi:hypothetical protein